jgi:hypothetical protein
MQKPTINLSINNNVQNVIVTPLGSGQYANSHHHGGAQNMGSASANNMGGQLNSGGQGAGGGMLGNIGGGQNVNGPGAVNSSLILGQAKQKRTSSEDNVTVQQQIHAQRQQ